YRYRAGGETGSARLGPATDPLTGQTAAGKPGPARLPLPPVTRSLLLGAVVSAGLHGVALAEGLFARGLAAGIRRAVPAADPLAGLAGHAAAAGTTVARLGTAMGEPERRAETGAHPARAA